MKLGKWLLVLTIGLIAVMTRLVNLDNLPGFLTNDEAAIAYNAYSIAKTGKDENGAPWPISFKSFNDYKAPGYMYILAPLTLVMPNEKMVVRLPSAIAGCLTVLFAGLLFFELTTNFWIAIIGSFLLSITPWHIGLSRMAMETNLSLFLVTVGLWLWFKRKKGVSALVLAASLYCYHTEKLYVPALMLLIQGKKWLSNWKFWLLFFIVLIPLFWDMGGQMMSNGASDTKWFWTEASVHNRLSDSKTSSMTKMMMLTKVFISNYGAYISPGYLFVGGMDLFPNRNFIQFGLFLLPEVVFMLIGIVKIKNFLLKEYQRWFGWWIGLLPVIPALTIGGPNLNRYLIAVVPLSLLSAVGLYWILAKSGWAAKNLAMGSVILAFSYFVIMYYGLYTKESGVNFQWGYEQIGKLIKNRYYDKYETIVVDRRFGDNNIFVGAPHLYIAYFTGLEPEKYQASFSENGAHVFDKYKIKEIDWTREKVSNNTLYIVPKDNLPNNRIYHTVEEIRLSNDNIEWQMVEVNND